MTKKTKKSRTIPVKLAAQATIDGDMMLEANVTLFVPLDQLGPLREILLAMVARRASPTPPEPT
jgi:hypothetical protein